MMTGTNNFKLKIIVLLSIAMIGIISVIAIDPIPQDPAYHLFADSRCINSIPNCWNVISNIPFLIIGAIGMFTLVNVKLPGACKELSINTFTFFLGIFFTGIGSAYYHWHPTNETLFWDRLPMTISFMAFFSIIIGEFISLKAGKLLLPQLLSIGFLSIIYWTMTESKGQGDLRFYALVQFLPMLLIPLIVLLFKSKYKGNSYLWLMMLSYLSAKVFEHLDHPVFSHGNFMSGHSIKHFLAALAPAFFLLALYNRKPLPDEKELPLK
jgi:hypothetical protein